MFQTMLYSIQNFTELNDKCLGASFEVSHFIVENKKPHTAGKTRTQRAISSKLTCIPSSANTVGRCIESIVEVSGNKYQYKLCSVRGWLCSWMKVLLFLTCHSLSYLLDSVLIVKCKKNYLL